MLENLSQRQQDAGVTHFGPITVGEILLEEYLAPMGVSVGEAEAATGVEVGRIVAGEERVSEDSSAALGRYFVQDESFWLGVQAECEERAGG